MADIYLPLYPLEREDTFAILISCHQINVNQTLIE